MASKIYPTKVCIRSCNSSFRNNTHNLKVPKKIVLRNEFKIFYEFKILTYETFKILFYRKLQQLLNKLWNNKKKINSYNNF